MKKGVLLSIFLILALFPLVSANDVHTPETCTEAEINLVWDSVFEESSTGATVNFGIDTEESLGNASDAEIYYSEGNSLAFCTYFAYKYVGLDFYSIGGSEKRGEASSGTMKNFSTIKIAHNKLTAVRHNTLSTYLLDVNSPIAFDENTFVDSVEASGSGYDPVGIQSIATARVELEAKFKAGAIGIFEGLEAQLTEETSPQTGFAFSYTDETSIKDFNIKMYRDISFNSFVFVEDRLETCVESWSCDAWSSCPADERTRSCIDANACGTTVDKPEVIQSCSIECNEENTQRHTH